MPRLRCLIPMLVMNRAIDAAAEFPMPTQGLASSNQHCACAPNIFLVFLATHPETVPVELALSKR